MKNLRPRHVLIAALGVGSALAILVSLLAWSSALTPTNELASAAAPRGVDGDRGDVGRQLDWAKTDRGYGWHPESRLPMRVSELGSKIVMHLVCVRSRDEEPRTRYAYLGVTEVTRAQWLEVMGKDTSTWIGEGEIPANGMSFHQATRFARKLALRLPTIAECEAAAGSDLELGELEFVNRGWFGQNSDGTVHPVGTFANDASPFRDIFGNVLEWVSDDPADISSERARQHGLSDWELSTPNRRIAFGGSALVVSRVGRPGVYTSVAHDARRIDLGFRVARDP